MILSVQRQVHDAIATAIRQHFGIAEVPSFAIEVPPTRALGDLGVPVAFQLARALRKAPKAIAQELAEAIGTIPGISRIVAAPNGYLNLYLDRQAFFIPRARTEVAPDRAPNEKTRMRSSRMQRLLSLHLLQRMTNAAKAARLVETASAAVPQRQRR